MTLSSIQGLTEVKHIILYISINDKTKKKTQLFDRLIFNQ